MSFEIKVQFRTGFTTLWAALFNRSGLVWNITFSTWEAWVDASIHQYDIHLNESGESSGLYVGSIPLAIVNANVITVLAYNGAVAAGTNPFGGGKLYWDGEKEIDSGLDINWLIQRFRNKTILNKNTNTLVVRNDDDDANETIQAIETASGITTIGAVP
jgi:hypothetical protein